MEPNMALAPLVGYLSNLFLLYKTVHEKLYELIDGITKTVYGTLCLSKIQKIQMKTFKKYK